MAITAGNNLNNATASQQQTLASNYIDLNLMQENNITHYWQLYDTPKYKQQGKFIENLSIIDLLFNCGSEEASHIVKNSGMKSDNI